MSELAVIRVGAFSGSGTSLRDALAEKVTLHDFDFSSAARRPSLWPTRLRALFEAARVGDDVPFSKTAAWSRGLERTLPPSLLARPALFIQTSPALQLDPKVCYGIYTDRLGREGQAGQGAFRSRATQGWVEREQRFVERARRLFVMGPTTREYAINEYGLDPSRIVVVGGAPNTKLGPRRMSTECRRLLFVGVDWRRKGLPDLLEAFAAVRATHGELTLDVIGGVPNAPAPPGVNIIGRVPHSQMPGHFSQSDLLVIPTHAEPFGIALVEALTMGIPVIGTTVGNQEWIIGTGGYTVKPGDTDSLSAAIRRAVDDYPALKAKAELRSDELKETMTWERIAERILSELLNDQVCGP